MKVDRLGVVRYSDDLNGPGAWFSKICNQLPHRVLPESLYVFHVLAPRTKLLHADEIRYV